MGCLNASKTENRDVSRTSEGLPNLDSMYRAVTPVAPLAEYTPNANKDTPPAAITTLSQSRKKACNPAPKTEPAVLKQLVLFLC